MGICHPVEPSGQAQCLRRGDDGGARCRAQRIRRRLESLWAAVITGQVGGFSAGTDLSRESGDPTPRGGSYGLVRRTRRKPQDVGFLQRVDRDLFDHARGPFRRSFR